jgi:replicative DNA helicase
MKVRVLPHSVEAERAMLAAALLSPDVLPAVAGRLALDDFYLERHRLIYAAMVELRESGAGIDLRTLQARLEHAGAWERSGGMAYLAALDLDLPDLGSVDRYVELVKERSVRRRLIASLGSVVGDAFDGRGVDAAEALSRAETAVRELGAEASRRTLTPLTELFEETTARLEERATGELLGIPSGFPDWDRLSEGLVAGQLVVVAGRPGMGKTSLALDVARHVAIRRALPVAVFSLEMSRLELTQRILAAESGLPFADLRAARLDERDWSKLYHTMKRADGAPLFIDDSAAPSAAEIASKARSLKARRGLALVVVDYLQLLREPVGRGGRERAGRSGYESRQQEVAALSRAFKVLAKELEVPVIVLSQLSRKPEERTRDHRPVLADLRESGAIEQDADMVCFVYREELYKKDDPGVRGLAELIVDKNRNGPTGTVELVFLGERATFLSRARDPGGPP